MLVICEINAYLCIMFTEITEITPVDLKPIKFKLSTVANGLGINKSDLVELLRKAGFVLGHGHDQLLTVAQLTVVKRRYVQVVKSQFKRVLSDRDRLGVRTDVFLQQFSGFVTLGWNSPSDPLVWELEDGLIEDHFYKIIRTADRYERSFLSQYKSMLKEMVRVVKACPGYAKSALHSIIPPRLFFTYVDEEDSYIVALMQSGSAVAGT